MGGFRALEERVGDLVVHAEEYNAAISAGALQADPVSNESIAALREQKVDGRMLDHLDARDWDRLTATLGERMVLREFAIWRKTKLREVDHPDWYIIAPASLGLNLMSYTIAVGMNAPALAIGWFKEFDINGTAVRQEFLVLLPGVALAVSTFVGLSMLRLKLGKDLIAESSVDISVRDSQRSNLTNTAIVSALLLTCIVAVLQGKGPLEDTQRFICQWYTIFNLIGMLWCFVSLTLSVLLLMYIEPLDDDASLAFLYKYLDYVGEPVGCIILAMWAFMNAAILWVFGQYGRNCGIVAVCVAVMSAQRALLTFFYFSRRFKNPLLDSTERLIRTERMNGSNALGANFGFVRGVGKSSAGMDTEEESAEGGSAESRVLV
jgi:hypothetical protein